MLSLKNLKGGSPKSVTRYAEHERDQNHGTGYYSQAGGAPSAWAGNGAVALGLSGRVDARDLERLLEGRIDAQNTLTAKGKTRRMGVDLSFSAPKSISLIGLAGGDDRVLLAHDHAVAEALRYIESDVAGARRGHGGAQREATGNIIAAAYRHEDARPVDGRVDPQLHTHAIVVNATQRADGKWVALDLDFGEHAVRMHTADEVYKGVLEREMRALGYDTRRTENGFELAAISDKQIEQFSSRRNQIDAALAADGKDREHASAAERTAANMSTRAGKGHLSHDEQRWAWRSETRAAGLQLDTVRQAAECAGTQPTRDLSAEAVRAAVRHVSERDTVFARDEVEGEALRAGGGDVTLSRIREAINRQTGGLLLAGQDRQGREQYTTAAALNREQAILARVRAGQGRSHALYDQSGARVQVEVWQRVHEIRLSQGQAAAVDLTLTSEDRVVGIVGAAGAGKTTAMRSVVDGVRERGADVIGLAPTTKAVGELRAAGVEPRTIASWLHDDRQPAGGQMILIDESGMISARDMQAVMERAEATHSRVVLVGDPGQLRSVEAGMPFAQMLESGAIQHAKIDEIQRQRDPALREIAQRFARGDAAGAVEAARPYMQEVQPVISEGAGKRETQAANRAAIAEGAAQEYLQLTPEQRQQTLVLAGTNEMRRQVNNRIREGLHATTPPEVEVTITALNKADLTRERATRAEHYQPGMVVAISEGKGGERHIEHYTVAGRGQGNTVLLRAADGRERTLDPARETPRGVYTQRDMALAVGDRIAYREAQGSARDGERIPNGTAVTVTGIDPERREATVRLDDGRQTTLDLARPQAVDYGWCRTVHASQGATVDRVIVAGEASRVATAETAYVACSRERESLTIITDDADKLGRAWEKQAERQIAHEATHARPRGEELRRMREDLGRSGDLAAARTAEAQGHTRQREADRGLER